MRLAPRALLQRRRGKPSVVDHVSVGGLCSCWLRSFLAVSVRTQRQTEQMPPARPRARHPCARTGLRVATLVMVIAMMAGLDRSTAVAHWAPTARTAGHASCRHPPRQRRQRRQRRLPISHWSALTGQDALIPATVCAMMEGLEQRPRTALEVPTARTVDQDPWAASTMLSPAIHRAGIHCYAQISAQATATHTRA